MKQYRKIGDICTVISGTTPKSNKAEYWNGNCVWITPAEISEDSVYISDSERHITDIAVKESSLKSFPKGTVILSSRAPIGKVAIAGCEMYCNQGFKNLICSDAVYNGYLYFYLKAKKDYLNALGRGATFKEISKKIVENIEIPLPEIPEQKRVAAILFKIDTIIQRKNSQLQKLEELVKSRFIEMFGDQTNSLKWPVVCVQDIASVQVGVVIKPAQYYTDKEHGIKTFRSLNIGPMFIKDNDWVYFSKEGNQKNEKSQLKENDLLIVRSGAPGTACVITKDYEGCNAVDVIIAHPMLEVVNPYYLCAYTNFPHGKIQIEGGIGGAAQQHFNVGKYNKVKVMLPPLELQNGFEKFFKQINKSKLAIRKSLDDLETLKKSLMQQYFG